ncbi:hypothetical protein [Ruminococcus albus]|uniref:hypothetical protein n=1 Tax=Ruminococcus albus TaxID=1264 RepID=UPI0005686578|nr:hypothetical protein [Ruminococcus albus]MCC3350454.1 hypothetical protein [Ruminococcus albus 8]
MDILLIGLLPFFLIAIYVIISISIDIEKKKENIKTTQIALKEQAQIDYFQTTKSISNLFCIDEKRKKWAIPKQLPDSNVTFAITKSTKIYDYSDIIDYQLIEECGTTTCNNPLSPDAITFSPTCRKIQIIITVNDVSNPTVYIDVLSLSFECKKDSIFYLIAHKNALDIISILKIITNTKNDKF